MGFHTGTITSWDESSGTNVVRVQGVDMSNLKAVQGGIGVLYQPGDVVAIMRFQTTYFVFGKVAAPGAGAANQIRSTQVSTVVNQPLQGFGDLTGSFGPQLTNVYIGSSQRCLVLTSTRIEANNTAGYMGFQVTGASSVSPSTGRASMAGIIHPYPGTTGTPATVAAMSTASVLLTSVDGINPGFHTFTSKYQISDVSGIGSGTGATFRDRSLTVIPF